jgi:hypothetical protein
MENRGISSNKKIISVLFILFYVIILISTFSLTGCSEGGLCGNDTSCGDCGCEDDEEQTQDTRAPSEKQEDINEI